MSAEATQQPVPAQGRAFLVGILIAALLVTGWVFRPFLAAIALGLFVASLARPIHRWGSNFMGPRKSAALTILVVGALIAAPVVALGSVLFDDAAAALDGFESGDARERVRAAVDPLLSGDTPEERNATFAKMWDRLEDRSEGVLVDVAASAPDFLFDLLIGLTVVLFVTYYILVDSDRLIRFLGEATPLPKPHLNYLLAQSNQAVHAVFYGQIITGLIQGAVGGIGFLIADVPGALFWTLVMGVLSIIPIVGAFLVWIPAAVWLFLEGDVGAALFLTGWGLIVVSFVDNLVRPKLIGSRAQIHPAVVLIGVLGGGVAFGAVGLFLGPLLVAVTIALLKVWKASYIDDELAEAPDVEAADPSRE